MLDIGWSEFLVIGVVALIVIGPRELPVALRTAGRYAARVKAMAREFRDGLDDIARESDLKDIKNTISGGKDWSSTGWMDDDKPAVEKPSASTDSDASATDAAKPVIADADEAALDEADFDDAQRAPAGEAAEAPAAPEPPPADVAPADRDKDRPV